MNPVFFATEAVQTSVLAELASSLLLLCWLMGLLFASVLSLGALGFLIAGFFPRKVRVAEEQALRIPGRMILLGAINIAGVLVVINLLGQMGEPFGILGLLIVAGLGYFALIGIAGLGRAAARTCLPVERFPEPLLSALGSSLLALACFFPLLGQLFGLVCLSCAVGSAVSTVRTRYSSAALEPGGRLGDL